MKEIQKLLFRIFNPTRSLLMKFNFQFRKVEYWDFNFILKWSSVLLTLIKSDIFLIQFMFRSLNAYERNFSSAKNLIKNNIFSNFSSSPSAITSPFASCGFSQGTLNCCRVSLSKSISDENVFSWYDKVSLVSGTRQNRWREELVFPSTPT